LCAICLIHAPVPVIQRPSSTNGGEPVRGNTTCKLGKLLKQSNGRFVDVHNYLILELPQGEMIVDATWPLDTMEMGLVVNEDFVLGEDHQIASKPIKTWVVPEEGDSQAFKNKILQESFTAEELSHRDEFIEALGAVTNSRWVRFLLWLQKLVKGSSNSKTT